VASIACSIGADTNAPVAKTEEIKAGVGAPAKKREKTALSGAELYSMNCNRCHAERYPTERTAAQWRTILLHMRVRANLPADQARTILKYLQDNSGR
jgi:cytochrome c5